MVIDTWACFDCTAAPVRPTTSRLSRLNVAVRPDLGLNPRCGLVKVLPCSVDEPGESLPDPFACFQHADGLDSRPGTADMEVRSQRADQIRCEDACASNGLPRFSYAGVLRSKSGGEFTESCRDRVAPFGCFLEPMPGMSGALPSGYTHGEIAQRTYDLLRFLCELLGSLDADHSASPERLPQDAFLDGLQVPLDRILAAMHTHALVQGGFGGQDEYDGSVTSRRLAGLTVGGSRGELSGVARGSCLSKTDEERGRYAEDCRARGGKGCYGFCLHARHRCGNDVRAEGGRPSSTVWHNCDAPSGQVTRSATAQHRD